MSLPHVCVCQICGWCINPPMSRAPEALVESLQRGSGLDTYGRRYQRPHEKHALDMLQSLEAAVEWYRNEINDLCPGYLTDYGPGRSSCEECSATDYDHDRDGHFSSCSRLSQ